MVSVGEKLPGWCFVSTFRSRMNHNTRLHAQIGLSHFALHSFSTSYLRCYLLISQRVCSDVKSVRKSRNARPRFRHRSTRIFPSLTVWQLALDNRLICHEVKCPRCSVSVRCRWQHLPIHTLVAFGQKTGRVSDDGWWIQILCCS